MSDVLDTVEDVLVDAPVDVEPPPQEEEQQPTPEEEAEAKAKAEAEEAKRKAQEQIDRRIGKERAKRAEAERKAQELEQRLAQYEKPKDSTKPPELIDFKSVDEWQAALSDYHLNKARDEVAKEATRKTFETRVQRGVESLRQKEQQAASTLPDFFDVVERAAPIIEQSGIDPDVLLELIESDQAALINYELSKDLDALEEFLRLPKATQLRRIGALEARLAAEPPKPKAAQVSKAPPPIKPVQASITPKKDPSKMNDEEWLAWRRKQVEGSK